MSISTLIKQSALPAALATATTSAAVTALTKIDSGSGAAGLNAVSHIVWGDKATLKDDVSAKYTLVGGALNSAAVGSWAAIHELAVDYFKVPRKVFPMLLTATVVSGIAYVTDYYIVPKRLTPGFEKRLTSRSMLFVYGALALGLAVGSVLARKR